MPDAPQSSFSRPAAREFPASVRTAATGESALQQASRLMEHLKKQLEELDRREANLNRQLITFDNERRGLRLLAQQIETQSAHREQQLAAREEEVLARESTCDARGAELDVSRRHLADDQQALAMERSELRSAVEQELAGQRDEVTALLDELDQREADLQKREAAALQAGVDLDKRTRLHEDHLSGLRTEISAERADLERETARRRIWATQLEEVGALRLAQIRKLRLLLDRREASLATEAAMLRDQQIDAAAAAAREREAIAQEQEELAKAIEEHAGDVERHQEMLTLQAQNLEGRRLRLDSLRDELELERQETLESRLSVEQVYAQTVHALDVATAQERVQTARTKLFDHYRELRDALTRRRQECENAQRQLVERRDSFQSERDEQLQRVAEREEQLAARSLQLADHAAAFAAREKTFLAARDRWRQDRLQAERIIRDLLTELEQKASRALVESSVSSIQPASSRIVPLPPNGPGHVEHRLNSEAAEIDDPEGDERPLAA